MFCHNFPFSRFFGTETRVADPNFDKFQGENAKFLLNVQGFEYLRRFLIDKGNPQKFSFLNKAKKLRNFGFLSRFDLNPDP